MNEKIKSEIAQLPHAQKLNLALFLLEELDLGEIAKRLEDSKGENSEKMSPRFGSMRGTVQILGDIVGPTGEWPEDDD